MRIEHWEYEDVMPDGKCLSGGALEVKQNIKLSNSINGGCSIKNCNCSDGHWMCINYGYNKENMTVSGTTIYFDDYKEMCKLLNYNFNILN